MDFTTMRSHPNSGSFAWFVSLYHNCNNSSFVCKWLPGDFQLCSQAVSALSSTISLGWLAPSHHHNHLTCLSGGSSWQRMSLHMLTENSWASAVTCTNHSALIAHSPGLERSSSQHNKVHHPQEGPRTHRRVPAQPRGSRKPASRTTSLTNRSSGKCRFSGKKLQEGWWSF